MQDWREKMDSVRTCNEIVTKELIHTKCPPIRKHLAGYSECAPGGGHDVQDCQTGRTAAGQVPVGGDSGDTCALPAIRYTCNDAGSLYSGHDIAAQR